MINDMKVINETRGDTVGLMCGGINGQLGKGKWEIRGS